MRLRPVAIAILSSMCCASSAAMAAWQVLGEGKEKIAIDRARVARVGEDLVSAWSRLDMPRAIDDAEGSYNAIEALNRYDCVRQRFVTLKRLYLYDDRLVRAESVLSPKEVTIAPASLDATVMTEVCKHVAQHVPGDVRAHDGGYTALAPSVEVEPRMLLVANANAANATNAAAVPASSVPAAPVSPLSVRRFLVLPRIDPSQIEHPTDEPPPADVAKKSATAAKKADDAAKRSSRDSLGAARSEAEKAGVPLDSLKGMDRRSRELALATSGPRREKANKKAGNALPAQAMDWGYAGEGAPSRWARLGEEYGLCESGQRQSPIDIREGVRVDMEPVAVDYPPANFRIVDTGKTIQVLPAEGGSISVMGRTYRLTQVHFHHPAEERIDGRGFEMSMHLEHRDETGRIATIAVMIERGEEHPVIQAFWNNLPLETNSELVQTTSVDLLKLLPEVRDYYAYMGSLTMPPCTEGVLWLVMKQPLRISAEQLAIFARLYPNNARPLQAANGRLIKETR